MRYPSKFQKFTEISTQQPINEQNGGKINLQFVITFQC